MKRLPLEAGTTIKLNSINYIVDTVIGDGATCIVYKAHYLDNRGLSHAVNIKECYPHAENVSRCGNVLIWESEEQRQNSISSFVTAFDKLMNRQLGNFTVHAFDIDEANGTQYIIMDANDGVTFDKDSSTSLTEILKTVKLLAHVVGQYHDNGYLHLDIKPSNFLVYPRPSEHIILFDMDSVTAIEDIRSGKISCVPYSKGWAAPEQMQGQINKLCPATDIYSIGAILFEKIMGRNVEPADTGLFADWDFDEKISENVNPKIKRLLRNIFKNTLAANVKRRYQNADELITALEEAAKTAEEKIYLISDYPYPNANFIGRQEELYKIESAFKNDIKTVFLHGFGGIGKSELAKKYAQIHKTDYDAILFLSYEDSLEELVNDIDIQNYNENSGDNHNKVLKRVLSKQKILLIIDNFDIEIDEDAYLDRFLRLNADIIFTTRTDFSELSIGNSKQINIENLKSKELISLFEKESGITFDESDRSIVDSVLKRYNYYTLIVPILAKQLVASGWSLDTLNEKTKQGLKAFESTEKIVIQKDGLPYRKTGLDLMRATFRMVKLSDIQKQVLINLYFLRFVSINKEEYRKYLQKDNENRIKHIDAINELLYLGWLKKKHAWQSTADAEIDIHTIIVEMIEVELQPDITKSDMLVAYINGYLPWSDLEQELFEGVDDWGNLHTDEIAHKLNWFCLFGASIDLHNINNLSYVADTFLKLLNGNIYIVDLINELYLDKMLSRLEFVFDNKNDIDNDTLFKIGNLFEIKWANELPRFYGIGNECTKEKELERQVHIKKYFFFSSNLVDKVSVAFRNTALKMLCKPMLQALACCGGTIYKTNVPKSIYSIVLQHQDEISEMFEDFYYIDWEKDDSSFIEDFDVVFAETNKKRTTKQDIVLNKDDEELYYMNKYKLGYDVDEIALELIEDTRFTNYDKAGIFCDITDVVFRNIDFLFKWWDEEACRKQEEFLKKTDWKRFLEISTQYLNFCQTNEFKDNDVNYDIYCAEQRVFIANLMLGEESALAGNVDFATSDMLKRISNITIDDPAEWKQYTQFVDIHDVGKKEYDPFLVLYGIGQVARLCRNLRKNHLILPSLIECANALECKIKDNYEELRNLISTRWYPFDAENDLRYDVNESGDPMSLMYNWYRNIAEFALNAYLDTGLTNGEYFEIYTEYLKKMKSFTDNSYAFVNYSSRSNKEVNFSRFYCQYETIADICETYYVNLYQKGIDIEEYKQRICEDKRISPINILSVCNKIACEEFFEIDRCWTVKSGYSAMKEYLKNNDWSKIEELLCFEEDVYFDTEDFEDESDAFSINSKCDMYRVLLYAIKGDESIFNDYMQIIFDDFKKTFEKERTMFHWSHFTEFNVQYGELRHQGLIGETFYWLDHIACQSIALPYLIKVSEYIHDWLKTLPNYSELMMYGWYKAIAEFANEDNDATSTYFKYQEKVDEMSGKDYQEDLDLIIE